MIKCAIILAGGLGTRLRPIVKDIPKPMADINGKPFLEYLVSFISALGVENIIISCGYKHDIIKDYFEGRSGDSKIYYSIEDKPLGTGGAIKKALESACLKNEENILILNGDTLFNIPIEEFYDFHKAKNSDLTLALKVLKNFDRYGAVEIDGSNRIVGFKEKKLQKKGYINGGVYILNVGFFISLSLKLNLSDTFSFEKDFIEAYYNRKDCNFLGFFFGEDNYFIDIGIPTDYELAKKELKAIN